MSNVGRELPPEENHYARPNQRWTCGWAAEGRACPLGPTAWGLCRAAHQCAPYRQGDRWICARTKAQGGACDEGPLPDGQCSHRLQRCRPRRSVQARRGMVSFFVFALAVGLVLILVGVRGRTALVTPGPLTAHHSTIVQSCEDCHAAGAGRLGDWMHHAVTAQAANQQSKLCLQCHRDLGPHAMQPHNQPPPVLADLAEGAAEQAAGSPPWQVAAARLGFGSPARRGAELACATCHREHRGAGFDLQQMADNQCQTCHTRAFHSLAHGHPEFVRYAYPRRTRLYFDHASHFRRHFVEIARAEGVTAPQHTCRDCHRPDPAGRSMLVGGFEQSCGDCHAWQIEEDLAPGLLLAALPAVDTQTLRETGLDVGPWPRLYPQHFAATRRLGPLLRLLLAADEDFAEIEARLAAVDLADLRDANPGQRSDAQALVRMIKQTLRDVIQGGQQEIQQRLASQLQPRVSDAELAELVESVPLGMLAALQQLWLPELFDEPSGDAPAAPPPANGQTPTPAELAAMRRQDQLARRVTSGWYLQASDLSLRYRPAEHADPVLKSLLDFSARFAELGVRESGAATAAHDLFASLASPFAVGRCGKCHTADMDDAGGRLNWRARQPRPQAHGFTRFSHAPHVLLLDDESCARCHQLGGGDAAHAGIFRSDFFRADGSRILRPGPPQSDFTPLTKNSCAACHTPRNAGDACLGCHNYHVH